VREAEAGKGLGDARGGEGGVVAADRDEVIDAEALERLATRPTPSGVRAGLVRDVRMIEPPSKWILDRSLIVSSTTCSVSPSTSHLKPS